MKKFILTVIFMILFSIPAGAVSMTFYTGTCGNASGDLDRRNNDTCTAAGNPWDCCTGADAGTCDPVDTDMAEVTENGEVKHYFFDDSATDTEDCDKFVRPENYSTSGVWIKANLSPQDVRPTGYFYTNEVLLTANDATPDVTGGTLLITQNSSGTTITDLVDTSGDHSEFNDLATNSLILKVIAVEDANTIIDTTGSQITGHGGVNFDTVEGDLLIFLYCESCDADGQWLMMPSWFSEIGSVDFSGFTASKTLVTDSTGKLIVSAVDEEFQILADGIPDADDTWSGGPSHSVKAGETLVQWDIVYIKYDTDGPRAYAYLADSADTDNDTYPPVGIAIAAATAGNAVTICTGECVVRNDGWSFAHATDEGKPVYCSEAGDGEIELTAPANSGDHVIRIGYLNEVDNTDNGDVVIFNFGFADVTVPPTFLTFLDDSDVVEDAITADQCAYGVTITNDDAGGAVDWALPDCAAIPWRCNVVAEEAETIVLDSAAGDVITLIDGTALTAADAMDSDGNLNSAVLLECREANQIFVRSQVGVWIDGGVD